MPGNSADCPHPRWPWSVPRPVRRSASFAAGPAEPGSRPRALAPTRRVLPQRTSRRPHRDTSHRHRYAPKHPRTRYRLCAPLVPPQMSSSRSSSSAAAWRAGPPATRPRHHAHSATRQETCHVTPDSGAGQPQVRAERTRAHPHRTAPSLLRQPPPPHGCAAA
ncbi:Uncharacterised protein [Mycobacteroides abscessus subsp. massiliense]|nr:Uncharacterised protein [Mycobacteroides abscessus subsp. massiliense]